MAGNIPEPPILFTAVKRRLFIRGGGIACLLFALSPHCRRNGVSLGLDKVMRTSAGGGLPMSGRAEQLKADLIEKCRQRIHERLEPKRAAVVERFLQRFYTNVPPDDIVGQAQESA